MPGCQICLSDEQEELEEVGLLALKGEISWRECGRRIGLSYHQPIKNHMEKHWVEPSLAEAGAVASDVDARLVVEVEKAALELVESMSRAPAELKPLYATAIKNLRDLDKTKPSQANLIAAVKTIQEVTGMKLEQQMLLQFAQAAFPGAPAPVPVESSSSKVIELTAEVLEAELVDEDA